MSDTNAPEPTMEEILASIRRIISEDDPAPQASSEADTASPPHGDEHEEDILELTERVDEAPEPAFEAPQAMPTPPVFDSSGDLDIYTRPEATSTVDYGGYDDEDEALVGAPAAQSASSAFGQLARSVSMPAEGRTLEDVTRELLRPLLKEWLDRNLPDIVEQAVQAEVERIARRR